MIIGAAAGSLGAMRKPLLVALAVAALVGVTATAANAEPVPTFSFSDCPAIPAGADPAQWRCEELVSHGTVTVGSTLPVARIRTTFAEGQLDGHFAQVFGALRSDPIRVPGGLLGTPGDNPLLRLDVRIEYAGYADFLSVGDQMGEQHLKLAVRSPLLPRTCTLGSDRDPIVFKPLRVAGPEVISQEPRVLKFSLRDNQFPMPGAHGCGALTRLVERRFAVPSAAGANDLSLTSYVGIRGY
jgi:hypothetical protein